MCLLDHPGSLEAPKSRYAHLPAHSMKFVEFEVEKLGDVVIAAVVAGVDVVS